MQVRFLHCFAKIVETVCSQQLPPGDSGIFKRQSLYWLGIISLLFLLGCTQPCRADAGVPMLAVMAVPMWGLLLVIIPLEAVVARRILSVPWSRCWQISAFANAVSTVAGMPLTWVLLTACEMALQFVMFQLHNSLHIGFPQVQFHGAGKFVFLLATFPWLYPFESDLYWMAPTAALLLLVPFFFASVWIEYFVARRFLQSQDRQSVMSWAWKANCASYMFMALITCALLSLSIVQHNQTASDEKHRSVDLVSADRLWQLSMERTTKQFEQIVVPPQAGPYRGLARRAVDNYYWDGRYQEESGHPEKAEKIWLSGVAMIDTESYQKSTNFENKYGDALNIIGSLASLYFKQGRFAEASPLYERMVRLEDEKLNHANPDEFLTTSYPLKLAVTYEKLAELDKADKFYQHVIAQSGKLRKTLKTDVIPTLIAYGDFCSRHQKFKEAEQLYVRAATTHAPNVYNGEEAPKTLAEFYMGRKQFDRAEQTLLAAMKEAREMPIEGEFPSDACLAPLALDLGKCYLETGNLAQAEHYIKVALRGYANLGDVARAYAILLEKRGDVEQAKVWRERAKLAEHAHVR
jgi:tetratricopeptide (TPR) repeat protein